MSAILQVFSITGNAPKQNNVKRALNVPDCPNINKLLQLLLLLEIDDKVVTEGQTRSRRCKKHTPRINKPRTAVEPQVTACSL